MRPRIGHRFGIILICAICTLVMLALAGFELFGRSFSPLLQAELSLRDWLVRMGKTSPVRPELVYLAIDHTSTVLDGVPPEEIDASPALSLIRESGWPWRRDVYPHLLDRLLIAGARFVAIDLMFPTPREGDEAFQAALERHRGRVVIGANFSAVERASGGSHWMLQRPSETILPYAPDDPRLGYVNFWPDPDGVVRHVQFHTSEVELAGYPRSPGSEVLSSLAARVLENIGESGRLPADRLLFRPTGPAGTFKPRSIHEILAAGSWDKPPYESGVFFRDKVVLIGPEGNWGKDEIETLWGTMPGPELHLQVINAALNGDFVRETTPAMNLLLVAAAGLAAWLLSVAVNQPMLRLALLAGVSAGWIAAGLFSYNVPGLFLPMVAPLVALNSSGLVALVWQQVIERIERARMRRTLERYVSKNVVREILDNPSSFMNSLGGVRRPVTILFTDLRGFTTLTEQSDSSQLVSQLNEYFSEMVAAVFEHDGTLDKFIGDAIMAVWGNVHSHGAAEDAGRAVSCAREMQARLVRLNKGWRVRGLPEFQMGVGINFGEAIVGNIGSTDKMELTVIGDPVNAASRVEGLTKKYGCNILLGEAAADLVREKFHLRMADSVQVVGKKRALGIYAIAGEKPQPLDSTEAEFLAQYERALEKYRAGEFAEAAVEFERCANQRPDEKLARLYVERCRELELHPPERAWDGIYVSTSK